MEKYIGFKMIEAEPQSDFNGMPGYKLLQSDGSWMHKEEFEKAYMQVGYNNTITQENVDNFIVDYEVFTKKEKITIVIATLVNGFTIVESSACVDIANYDEKYGSEICKEKIKDKVWNHLGFLLQTAKDGIK